MRTLPKLLLAGAALALGTAAVAGAAEHAHVLDVALPDGSIARIRYVGDVAPQLVVAPATMPVAFADPAPFAMFDRISAMMDRQMTAMLQQASLLAAASPVGASLSDAALKQLPPGTVSYSYTSYSSGDGAGCSQSVRVTALSSGDEPKVVRESSGDCSAMNRREAIPAVQAGATPATPAPLKVVYPAPVPKRTPKTVI